MDERIGDAGPRGEAGAAPADRSADRWQQLGVYVEQRMIRAGRSKADLARAAGVSANAVATLLRGGRHEKGVWVHPNPRDDFLAKLAAALGIDAAELFDRAGGTFEERNGRKEVGGALAGRPTFQELTERVERQQRQIDELLAWMRQARERDSGRARGRDGGNRNGPRGRRDEGGRAS